MSIVLESESLMSLMSAGDVDPVEQEMTHLDNRGSISNRAVNQYFNGGAYLGVQHPDPGRREGEYASYNLGLRLSNAPQVDEDDFVGHETELKQLRTWLAPRPNRQNVVALCGIGRMGKTRLSIHFARRFVDTYSSIFLFNGQNESALKTRLVELAAQVLEERNGEHEQLTRNIFSDLSILAPKTRSIG